MNSLPLKRIRYFFGQVLSADDLGDEQQYFREKHRRHNRCFHGSGVVCGLEVSITNNKIIVNPGFALNCGGEEIVVYEPVELLIPEGKGSVYLTIRFAEKETDPTPVPGAEDTIQNSRIEEGFEITLEGEDPCPKHKRDKARWRPCGSPHGIPLAKFRYSRGQGIIDHRYRRPRVI